MDTTQQTSREYFRALRIIYFAIIAGPTIFGLIAFFLIKSGNFEPEMNSLHKIFVYIVPAFAITGILGSTRIFKSQLSPLRQKKELTGKMEGYRSALIVRYALIEGPAFFAIVVYMLTGIPMYLGIAGLVLLSFLTLKPTAGKAAIDLELNPDEKQIIVGKEIE